MGDMNKKLEKALNWTVAIVGIIGTLYFTSAKHDDLHETHLNGEETIGIVVKRSTGRSVKPGTGSSKVDYVFNQDGKWIQGTYYGREYYFPFSKSFRHFSANSLSPMKSAILLMALSPPR